MSWCPNVLNGHIYIVSCPFLYRITPRRQVWPGGTRTSAATETTRTASPSSPTGRRTGERGCLLSLTWFHREKTQKPASAPRRIWVWVSGQKTHRRSFPFCSRAFLVRLLSHIFGGTCFETHCLFFIVLPSVSAFLRQFFTYKCSFRPTRMEHSSLWTQMWPNSKLVNINIYKTISVSRPHWNSLLFYCWKKIQTESEEKISVVSSRYFLSFYSFFSFLVFIYVPSFFFLIIFIFHFYLFVCGFGRWVGCFFAVAWPAWLRWLVPLAPLLPLRPLRSVPRPVRCGWGIKPSARCTLARQAGPRCPTPTTLWTTARPSKTAGPPNLPPCLSPLMSQPLFGPFANPHIQPASHSVTPQLNHGHHFLQTSARRV